MIKFGEWYPIENAPKNCHIEGDGDSCYIIGTDGKAVEPIFWGTQLESWEWPDDGIEREDPIYWMPLPPPPRI